MDNLFAAVHNRACIRASRESPSPGDSSDWCEPCLTLARIIGVMYLIGCWDKRPDVIETARLASPCENVHP